MHLRLPTILLACVSAIVLVFGNAAFGITVTRGPYLQLCSSTGVVVRWRTDAACDSRVVFRAENQPGELMSGSTSRVTEHQVRLIGLTPDTKYFYSIGTSSNTWAGGPEFYFRTSPTNSRPVRVWAIGDSGTGTTNQTAVRDAYRNFAGNTFTDVWLMLGDNVYEHGTDEEYQLYMFDIYPDLFRNAVLWPAMGNHDAPSGGSPATYLNMLTLPMKGEAGGVPSQTELYYSFDYANVHFVCVDSWLSDRSTNGAMLNWLRADLAATTKEWTIVYWHHPPYSMGTDFSDTTPIMIAMREQVLPVLESHGVDLVLCGHSHVYERSFLLDGHYGPSWTFDWTNALNAGLGREGAGGPYRKPAGKHGNRGTVYVVCGNSGQGGDISFQHHPAMAVKFDGYGSLVLDIDGPRLDAKYLRANGVIDDSFTIDKSPFLNIRRNTNSVLISWPTSPAGLALEFSATLPGTNWQAVTNVATVSGASNSVNVNATNAASFFRLRSVP